MSIVALHKNIKSKNLGLKIISAFFVVALLFTNTALATDPAPTISGVSPNNGLPTGGNSVTITGTGFLGGGINATGGTVTTDGAYTVHKFTSSGTFTVTSGSGNVEALVVAGGGGGGGNYSGSGGGGGGVVYNSSFSVSAGSKTVTVGGGGSGGANGAKGSNGGNSVFDSIVATGGGGGAYNACAVSGNSGGSGGGAAGSCSGATYGNGIAGQGNRGGSFFGGSSNGSGGGGGAGAIGGNGAALLGGSGGVGLAFSISGSNMYYGGGGGGSTYSNPPSAATVGAGGLGGGGNGSKGGDSCGSGGTAPTAGSANTGGGGGGGERCSTTGGAGGSGIVIVRYLTPVANPTVTFGGTSATDVTVVNSTTITATVPAHVAGTADVVVTNYDGQSATLTNGYTFNPAPTISAGAVTPASAKLTGGDTITITGSGFYGTPTITLGGTTATAVTVVNPTTITATTPAHAVGAVDVVVTNEDSQSATLTGGFTFTELPPTLSSISPTAGSTTGGTNVTISGTNFQVYGNYRKPIALTNANASNLTDFQVSFTTNTQTLVSEGKMQADGRDIRIIDSDGVTPLSYWIESGINTTTTKIWVNVPLIPVGGKTVYLVYGNSANTAQSSTTDTFVREIANLKGLWKMDEASGNVLDSSGGNYTGVPTGTTVTAGKYGNGRNLNGTSDFIQVTNNSNYDIGTGDYTVNTWVYRNANATTNLRFLSKGANLVTQKGWTLYGSDTGVNITIGNGTTRLGTGASYLGPGNWNFVTMVVKRNDRIYLYINGVLANSADITSFGVQDLSYAGANAFFGRSSDGAAPLYWPGKIDHVSIFKSALTAEEISDMYNNYGYGTTSYTGKMLITKTATTQPVATVGSESSYAAMTVSFGGVLAANAVMTNPTTITATTPAHVAETADVVVTNYDGQSATLTNGYTFNPAPTLSAGAVSPASAKLTGGDTIAITGTGFYGTPTVTLGGTAASAVTVVNSTTITATTPAHAVGAVDVVVTNEDSQSATLTNGFTFTELPPTASSISPNNGSAAGGASVTISGTNFLAYGNYRKPIALTNANASNLTDFQVSFTTNTQTLVSEGKMQADGRDIRIIDSDGVTPLSYWIESGINTTTTKIWVNVPLIPVGGKTVYLVYGNSANTAQSSTANTFIREIANLKGLWNMDEASGNVLDVSGGGYTGTPTGTTVVAGKIGNARTLNGTSDFIQVTNNANYDIGTGDYTINAWFWRNANATANSRLFSKGSGSDTEKGWSIAGSDTYFNAYLSNGTTRISTSASHPGVGSWNLISMVIKRNDSMYLYVNGILANSVSIASFGVQDLSNTSLDMFLGRFSASNSLWWPGKIDQVSIFKSALSTQEILDLYNNYGYGTTSYTGKMLITKTATTQPVATVGSESSYAAMTVSFGGVLAANAVMTNPTTITATTPAHVAETADVVVTNYDGQSATLTNGYTFNPAPTLSAGAVSPASAKLTGGDTIAITGTGFYGTPTVTLGGTAASAVTVVNSTTITATTPAHAVGAVDVVVTNEDSQSATLTNGFTFTELPPTASSISPNNGPVGGGTNVTITGTNFIPPNAGGSPGWETVVGKILPGNVFGATSAVIDNYVYLFGGTGLNTIYRAPVSDPTSWTDTGKTLPSISYVSNLAVIGNTAYLFGGHNGTSATNTIYSAPVSDPTTWVNTGTTLPISLYDAQISIIGDTVYLFGGRNSSGYLNTIYSASVSDPTTWINTTKTIPGNSAGSALAIIDDSIYLFGGYNGTSGTNTIYSASVSDPTTWANTGAVLPVDITYSNIIAIGSSLYLLGGYSGSTNFNTIYSAPVSNPTAWTNTGNVLPASFRVASSAVIDNYAYLFGGFTTVNTSAIYRAPVVHNRSNVINKSWLTNWPTIATDQSSIIIGGTSATNISVTNPTTITATTPSHAAGTADVVVTNYDGQSATLTNAFEYHNWITAGTYTSTVKPLANTGFGNINWVAGTPANTNLTMRVKSCTTADCSDKPSWTGCDLAAIDNGTDISGKGCVVDGNGFVQYQAYLSTDSASAQPYLDSVTIATQASYATTFLKLISSPFNTGNENSSVQKISWTATNDDLATQGQVAMQIRTAPDNGGAPDFTNSTWCGPTDCSATLNSTTAFATSYYTDKTGAAAAINDINKDLNNDQWIQYATFLKSADGTLTPTLTDVTMQYAYNIPPTVVIDSNPANLKQNSDGTFSVPYTLSETYDDLGNIPHGTSGSPIKALLFYQPKNDVTLSSATPASMSTTAVTKIWGQGGTDGNTAAGSYTFTVPAGVTNIRNIEVAGGGGGSGTCGLGVIGADGIGSTMTYASTQRANGRGGYGSGYDGSIDDCTAGADSIATNSLGGTNTTGGGANGSSLGGGKGGLVSNGSLTVTSGSQINLVVGAGGAAATGGTAGEMGWIKITYDIASEGAQTTGLVSINNPSNVPIPSQGSMLLNDELVTFDSVGATGNQRNITARASAFETSYSTTAASHSINTPVFFATSSSIHTIDTLTATGTVGAEASVSNTFIWDPRVDVNANLNGNKFSDLVFKVAANDADSTNINNIGQSAVTASQVLDLEAPMIKNITSSSADGKYNAGKNIDVTINFADSLGNAKNVTSTGEITIKLETGANDYDCLISAITNSATASCTYQVQANDASEDLTAISVSGVIKDQFQNELASLAIPAGQNIADSKAIVIDTIAPIISNAAPIESAFVNSVTSANGGSDISYEAAEVLKTGSYIKFISTAGTDLDAQYLCTLQGTALNIGAHSNFEIKQDTNNCAEVQSALQSGSVYTMTVHAIDEADNIADQVMTGITFDNTNPTISITSPSNDAFFNSITSSSDVSYNLGEQLQTGTYLRFTRTGGSADSSSPRTCNLTGAQLTAGDHNNVDLNAVCGGFNLVDGAIYSIDMQAVDLANNIGDASQKTNITFDQTAPTLTSFTSDKTNNTPSTGYGAGEVIDIKAVYAEPLASGSTITVQLENTASPAINVVLDQISGNVLSGTFIVDGPRKGYDTIDLTLRSIVSENVIDLAGNIRNDSTIPSGQNLANNKDIVIDTGTPILLSFDAKKLPENLTSGSYNEGTEIKITATYSKPIASGEITLHLNTQNGTEDSENITLSTISDSTIFGTHTVQNLDNANDLKVSAITAQSATDFKGNVLDRTGTMVDYDAYFTGLVGENISAVTNIVNFQIDTTLPTLGGTPIAIASVAGKTNSATPTITLSATDNNLSKAIFSMDGGTSWCAPIDYASSINTFNITSTACGGNSTNGNKTVTVKFSDVAGNESATANATVEYDNLKPQIQTITTDTVNGTYGPASAIKIIVTYDENIASGNLVVNLNNGKQLPMSTVENGNTLTATYTVGATGSIEDVSNLRVAAIVSQAVLDSAGNTQDSTSLAGITANIDTDKTIEIDVTAPEGTIVINRSASSNQVHINATDANSDNMQAEILPLATHEGSCSFTNSWITYADNIDTTIVETDPAASARKICVRFRDELGNVSDPLEPISAITPETPTGTQVNDISNSEINFYGSMLTWQIPVIKGTSDNLGGDPFAQYEIAKCASDHGDVSDCTPNFASGVSTIANIDENYFVSTGLIADDVYCYQVRFKDKNGDYSALSKNTCIQAGHAPAVTDSRVAIISGKEDDIQISNVTEQGATVYFQTTDSKYDRPVATKATISVYAGATLAADTLIKTTPEEATFEVAHIINIDGLESGTQYYLKITAIDSSVDENPGKVGVLAYSPDGIPALTFTTLGTLKTITEVTESIITDTKAVISFVTDQEAKCLIEFKDVLTQNYNDLSDSLEKDFYRNHSITLTQLLPTTTYDYRIFCSDKNDVSVTSEGYQFITAQKGLTIGEITQDKTAPQISAVSLASVTGESATITWNTDEKANSSVAYEAEGATFTKMEADWLVNSSVDKYATAHSVTVNNLVSDTKYLFTVMSTDAAGNITLSSQSSFTTKQPSTLSSIKVISTALGQATITWSTGEASSSSVEYGLTTAYGQKKEDSSKVKEHQIILSELKPGETYHFRVKGQDAEGNIFSSSDITFQPKSPPKISDFRADSITEHGGILYFNTSVPTDALVTYTDVNDAANSGLQGNPNITAKHEIKLRDLSSGGTFAIKIKVRDEDGNETEENFPNIVTTKDETSPVIENIKTDAALAQNDKVQAIISWRTDELSKGKIVYKEGKNGDEKTFEVSSAPAFSHIGVITSFKSGVVYYFKVIALDQAGNESTSTNYGLLTPKKTQNIIQIIIGNFTEIFGWAKF